MPLFYLVLASVAWFAFAWLMVRYERPNVAVFIIFLAAFIGMFAVSFTARFLAYSPGIPDGLSYLVLATGMLGYMVYRVLRKQRRINSGPRR